MTEVFPIVPAAGRSIWVLVVVVGLMLLVLLGILVATARGSSSTTFEISDKGLRIRGDLYGQLVRASSMKGGAARVVDLEQDPSVAPKWKSMGTAVPGYRSGWFRLRNGREALVYLTDRRRAVHVPTTAGFDLLLSPKDPERFVDQLRAIAPGS